MKWSEGKAIKQWKEEKPENRIQISTNITNVWNTYSWLDVFFFLLRNIKTVIEMRTILKFDFRLRSFSPIPFLIHYVNIIISFFYWMYFEKQKQVWMTVFCFMLSLVCRIYLEEHKLTPNICFQLCTIHFYSEETRCVSSTWSINS